MFYWIYFSILKIRRVLIIYFLEKKLERDWKFWIPESWGVSNWNKDSEIRFQIRVGGAGLLKWCCTCNPCIYGNFYWFGDIETSLLLGLPLIDLGIRFAADFILPSSEFYCRIPVRRRNPPAISIVAFLSKLLALRAQFNSGMPSPSAATSVLSSMRSLSLHCSSSSSLELIVSHWIFCEQTLPYNSSLFHWRRVFQLAVRVLLWCSSQPSRDTRWPLFRCFKAYISSFLKSWLWVSELYTSKKLLQCIILFFIDLNY